MTIIPSQPFFIRAIFFFLSLHICSIGFIHMYTLLCVHIIYLAVSFIYTICFCDICKKVKEKYIEKNGISDLVYYDKV